MSRLPQRCGSRLGNDLQKSVALCSKVRANARTLNYREANPPGNRLYVHMNCVYCHGFAGQGGMGPNLADDYWRFGGDDADVFKSIFEGRGKGMPAWGAALSACALDRGKQTVNVVPASADDFTSIVPP